MASVARQRSPRNYGDTQMGPRKVRRRPSLHIRVSAPAAGFKSHRVATTSAHATKPSQTAGFHRFAGGGILRIQEVQPSMPETVTKPKTKVKTKTERPRLHKVILI